MTAMSADRTMIKIAMSAPYLAREEERDLAIRWKDRQDQGARNQIALAHMRLVIAMASKFRGFGLPMSDLVQEGYVGLLEAAARFEPARDVRFSTYASWWIRASMQDYILRNWSIVRGGTSSAQKALFFNLRRLRAKLARGDSNLTAQAIHEEIAVALGVSVSDVQTNRIVAAQSLADRWQCVVVLKGSGTVIAAPGKRPCINPTGNARLATAGTGDVLAGLVGSYLAQKQDAFSASCAAVYRHGKAADLWPASAGTLTAHRLAQAL